MIVGSGVSSWPIKLTTTIVRSSVSQYII
jgi:hypothetical protein